MEHKPGYIAADGIQLHYLQWGSGKKLLLAFHGYGESAHLFDVLQPHLEHEFTVVSIDLPYHGSSSWAPDHNLTGLALAAITERLMSMHQVSRVSLIGYSLGGRVCLAIMEQLPELMEKIVLLAPDGLRVDPYYSFFTQNRVGKLVFRDLLLRPMPYFRFMSVLHTLKLVHPKRYKFALHFLGDKERRQKLLEVWPAMRHIMPVPGIVKEVIRKHKIRLIIFMGAYDKIMPPSLARRFQSGLDTVAVNIIDKGHRLLDHETAVQVAASLL